MSAGGLSAADILVASVLRMVRHTELVAEWPVLVAYQARREGHPRSDAPLDDQIAAFAKHDRGA